MQVVHVLIDGVDERREGLVDQAGPVGAEQRGRGEVRFQYEAGLIQGAIADRSEIVEVEVARARRVEHELEPAQLLVLHLELDLVDLELVQDGVGRGSRGARAWRRRLGADQPIGPVAQSPRCRGLLGRGLTGHGRPPRATGFGEAPTVRWWRSHRSRLLRSPTRSR